MTDDVTGTDPTRSPGGRSWRIPLLVGALVIVIVVAVAIAVGQGNDDDGTDATSDPTTASSTSTSTSPSASDSPTASEPPSASASPSNGDPVPSPIINKAVKAAIKEHFPALVPAGVPYGWTVVAAAYDDTKGGTWRIDLTDPSGAEVVLVQADDSVEQLVAHYLGNDATAEGKLDLSDYGTGVWTAYGAMDSHGIAKKISDTSALVYATTQDIAVELAQQLLTAEDSGNTDGG